MTLESAQYFPEVSRKTLLITGGTGTLGNAIIDHLQNYTIFEKIIIYSRDEQKQQIMAEKYNKDSRLRFFIGDVRDKNRLRIAIAGIDYIIHTAALKIVPSIEYNCMEAVKTNILGSQNIIEVCAENKYIKKVMGISTDKAVHPINLYGTTKAAMEKLFLSAAVYCPLTKFSICRYGNVTNSRGSVIPYFKELINQNKALTVTDLAMTRFYITKENAAKFVIDSLLSMQGEEIFIPEMKAYRISDLAEILVENNEMQLSSSCCGLIKETGKRPGEKIHEDLVAKHEFEYLYEHDNNYIISKKINQEYKYILDNAKLSGIATKDTYNSSMFIMSKDELRTTLERDGIIDKANQNNVVELGAHK